MNTNKPCETPDCPRQRYHPNRPLCLECESAKIDAEKEAEAVEPDPGCGVDDLFEDEE